MTPLTTHLGNAMLTRSLLALALGLFLSSCAGAGGSSSSDGIHYDVPQDEMISDVLEIVRGMGMDIQSADRRDATYRVVARHDVQESGRHGRSVRAVNLRINIIDVGDDTTRLQVTESSEQAHYGSHYGPRTRDAFLRLLRQREYPRVAQN